MQKELLASKRLLVVGDSMLDRYWFGDANRISPEAPVPVVRVVRTQDRLGGAANVALNIKNLGAQASLMSVVGHDEAGATIRHLLTQAGITPKLHVDPSLKTTVKLRLLARQQQIVRVDFEEAPQHEVLASLLTQFEQVVGNYDALLLSDYGKGGLSHITRMIEVARARNIPVLIDPKGSDYDRYKGATVITPNRSELELVVGPWKNEDDLNRKAQKLREQLELKALLLTRSEEGMTLFTEDSIVTIPAQAREVFDVSGAGDTVIAVLASMIAAGVPMQEAVQTANRAGGIVVGKLGTASVSYAELFE
ncbi:MAG: D-glycero-beta-D-manno-heptose-7-phosphate kinase [Duodenibacillus sp.]|nr:D-glycero-beta-D-manno-heptose-7-phosphate kinase [Duodenibacillus sp.]